MIPRMSQFWTLIFGMAFSGSSVVFGKVCYLLVRMLVKVCLECMFPQESTVSFLFDNSFVCSQAWSHIRIRAVWGVKHGGTNACLSVLRKRGFRGNTIAMWLWQSCPHCCARNFLAWHGISCCDCLLPASCCSYMELDILRCAVCCSFHCTFSP